MKFLKILLAILLILVVVFFLGAYLLPDRVRISREIAIDRPVGQVFAIVNDLRRFNDWSPWFDSDPDATYRHEGPDQGAGAALHWSGNDAVGKGSLRIVASEAPSRVITEVSFDGFPVPARGEFLIEPVDADGSRVAWSFDTELQGPLARWFGLLMPRYVGTDYEKGLARLKALVEAQPAVDFGDLDVGESNTTAFDVIALAGEAPADDLAATSLVLGDLYGRLLAFAAEQNLDIIGQPLTITDELGGTLWRFQAALPVRATGAVQERDAIGFQRIAPGRALVLDHVGPYDGLASALVKLDAYAVAHGFRRSGPVRSVYVSDPGDTAPEALVTRIVYPIAD